MRPDEPGTIELLLALKSVAPFSALPPDDVALLVERARLRRFAPDAVLVGRGTPVGSVHLLLEGRVLEERGGAPWAERSPYEIIGGVDVLAGDSRDVAARAAEPSRTLELGRDELLDVCADRYDVLTTVAAGVAGMAIAARGRLGPGVGYPAPRAAGRAGPREEPNLAQRVARLRGLPPLRDTPLLTLAGVAATAAPVRLARGERAWAAGDPADHVLLVVAGRLDCVAASGRFALGAGDAAGVLDALASLPRWYDAMAATRVLALRARIADVLDVLEDDPEAAVALLTRFAAATLALIEGVARRRPNGSAPAVDLTDRR